MTLDLPFELGDELYGICFETDNAPHIERVRVRGVLITREGTYIVGRDGSELLVGRDVYPEYEDAERAVEHIRAARRAGRRRIPVFEVGH